MALPFDPSLAAAISLHSAPGTLAVLVGSGISRPSGIYTGWEIVLDLVRKVAQAAGEDAGASPDEWYEKRFGHAPTYTDLLAKLAPSSAARGALLGSYFEASEADRTEGRKQPTSAHRAIARLVARGNVRVILTTNFDRLMESALVDEGIQPVVISTPAAAAGAMPLTHTKCTIIKLHGDYKDSDVKNTDVELAAYDPATSALLTRVLDEHGLIVCGWSSEYDAALRHALEFTPCRRFGVYWAHRGKLGATAATLSSLLGARTIEIADADSFFTKLDSSVTSLGAIESVHPLSPAIAVASLKRDLFDPRQRIRVRDLVLGEADAVISRVQGLPVSVLGDLHDDFVRARIESYESLMLPLIAVCSTGGHWDERTHAETWRLLIERLLNYERPRIGHSALVGLQLYPALLALYAFGIPAVAARHYSTLHEVLHDALARDTNPMSAVRVIRASRVLLHGSVHAIMLKDTGTPWKYPAAERLMRMLRDPLRSLFPDGEGYEAAFIRFEFLLSLAQANYDGVGFDRGRWVFAGDPMRSQAAANNPIVWINEHLGKYSDNWDLLKAGWFNGSRARLIELRDALSKESRS